MTTVHQQLTLTDRPLPGPRVHLFDGETAKREDGPRLTGQVRKVYEVMRDRKRRTLLQMAAESGVPATSVGSRFRDLRKARFGAFDMRSEEDDEVKGLWWYWMEG